ncbi:MULTISPECIES: NAD(P)H-dependent glycerol-3-phosphate dehydrogenase [Spongiibacter]|uniref:NAD(P)H-dependent glycerol-3-phosphate dehydrogenase n=1 Tax=Spongiibacter TaxID=630749 RepID=UPI001B2F0CC4|nr:MULTISPECIES: NAD(P)H-dependent glycerol-3-phosphate dehydrogenase [Spongiibacter]MBO6754549.1 NAD(P)H-dependent glycerol-3-phosphate dehydrogenase [Spongiibacter sp.]|tara:strand:- start:16316 stop:17332 length:1017 start_codon:yes stop_codon:yes gene_type:complete
MTDKHKVAIVGGGSFGTAIANIVADKGHDVCLWMRNAERADEVNTQRCNSAYLPGIALNPSLRASADLADAVDGCDVVFVAVPSKSCREVARQLAPLLAAGTMVVSTTKGMEAETNKLMSQVLGEELGDVSIGVMSGPNLAKELAAREITGTVIASEDESLTRCIQDLLQCAYFRVYAGSDVYGVELAGALKNVYAIVAGLAAALGVGHNTISMLITRSLAEMSRYAVREGADPLTFLGLAGVGDLFVTCTSPLSRNYRVGFELGKGRDLNEVVAELGQVAEGVNTLKLLKQQSEVLDIYMPLVNGLYGIIYEGKTVSDVIGGMMWAEQNRDVEFAVR